MNLDLGVFDAHMYLPEVAEDNNDSQYNAAHSYWDQQGHVVDFSIYVD